MTAAAAAKSLESCPTLCDPIDGSPPGSPIPGILQERTLEWVSISFSNAWKWKVKVKLLSRVWPSVTSWTAAFQTPPFMGFSRQEYWSGVPLPSLRLWLRDNKSNGINSKFKRFWKDVDSYWPFICSLPKISQAWRAQTMTILAVRIKRLNKYKLHHSPFHTRETERKGRMKNQGNTMVASAEAACKYRRRGCGWPPTDY